MLPSDVVRWVSLALFLAYLGGAVLTARNRGHDRRPPDARASRPLSLLTGRLWVLVVLASGIALFVAAIWPDAIYTGPLNARFPADAAVQVAGLAAWLLGGWLFSWSVRTLGRQTRLEILVTRDHTLVTTGPYRWIRHPMYTSVLLMNAGLAAFLLNGGLVLVFVLTLAGAWSRASLEEDLLASEQGFGEEYRAHMRRTGRFLPRFREAR